jgi:hypothetical protein
LVLLLADFVILSRKNRVFNKIKLFSWTDETVQIIS